MIVLDTSAAIEALQNTDEGHVIRQALGGDETVISCDLLRAEMGSALRKFARTTSMSAAEALDFLNDAVKLVDEFYPIEALQAEALAESIRLDHSVYGMFYFVLARRTRGTLFTVDKQLLKLSEQHGVPCMTLIDS